MKRLTSSSRGRKPFAELGPQQQHRIRSAWRDSLIPSTELCEPLHVVDRLHTRPPIESMLTSVDSVSSLSEVNSTSGVDKDLVDASLNDISDDETEDETNGYDSNCSLLSSDEDDEAVATDVVPPIFSPDVVPPMDVGASTFAEDIATCFVANNISLKGGDSILAVLRKHECFSSLPNSSKTLLAMKHRPSPMVDVEPGQYIHLGFETAVVRLLKCIKPSEIPSILNIDISTDGATLGKSSKYQIWPIQCRIVNVDHVQVEIIGVYRGLKKPKSAMDFLKLFIDEANVLIVDGGVAYSGRRIPISFRALIADAPARAYILNHMGHNSYNPCSKCKVSGKYVNGRMTFASLGNTPRTDDEYRRKIDEDHHKEGDSPLSLLPIDMVRQVPFEYMHLVCLGVMKRMLMAMVDGKFAVVAKLSSRQIGYLSERLECLADYCPTEFSRRPEPIAYYNTYKATQFRQILLHTGPVIFEGIVDDDHLQHFLLLHASLRILASVSPSEHHLVYAEKALHIFVRQCTNLYGEKFSSYNIHCLLHLVEDVKLLGPIDGYSAFPYENNMKIFRGYCRKPDRSLQQIVNRRAEQAKWIEKHSSRSSSGTPAALNQHSDGPLPADILQGINLRIKQYRRAKCQRFVLAATKRDSCCIMKDGSIVIVCNIIVLDDEIYLVVRKFAHVTSFYDIAIPSSSVGSYKCSELEGEFVLVSFGDVANKGYRMPHWLPRQYGDGGQQTLAEGEFVVTSMACDAYY